MFKLGHHLPASTTWRTGLGRKMPIGKAADSDSRNRQVGMKRMRIKERCSFRTKARWIGAILLIGATHDGAIRKTDSRTYREMRIRTIRVRYILFGGFYQFADISRQFIFFISLYLALNGERFHLPYLLKNNTNPPRKAIIGDFTTECPISSIMHVAKSVCKDSKNF